MIPLFVSDVPLHCVNEAAYEYHVPAKLIIAVLNVERGRVGLASRNKNGTYDLGPMQVNTSWWPELYRYNITTQEVLYNSCSNVQVGSWILAKALFHGSNLFRGIGNYHSYNIQLNEVYAIKIETGYTRLTRYLNDV